ncbi:MAG: bifunctional DNA-formamidopyrimidine glycosylase/DNA-(apurinic or apyrimidinic site) lyase [Planctomycetaceae bacterium]|nr:bifunctional DNA-formamidopyrimidine glycosylase/DNA-(apurinic or apyrimidinic site) lyase [Planctomycetaceae bacterium]
MPELPEVEHLRRSLDPWIVGARVTGLRLARRGVVELAADDRRVDAGFASALGVGSMIVATHRKGKQMAIELSSGRVFVVQLGMTGSLALESEPPRRGIETRHRHVRWDIEPPQPLPTARPATESRRRPSRGATSAQLVFRDPRRFGGIVAYRSMETLRDAWSLLGPDALTIEAPVLADRLRGSTRPVKAALLDQSTLAGVGNIYADESLHAARIHPLAAAGALEPAAVGRLAIEVRRILGHAVERGGSTLRDYRDAFGRPGDAVQVHRVYGRAGQPCLTCGATLLGTLLQARATVFCPICQDLSTFQNHKPTRSGRRVSTR